MSDIRCEIQLLNVMFILKDKRSKVNILLVMLIGMHLTLILCIWISMLNHLNIRVLYFCHYLPLDIQNQVDRYRFKNVSIWTYFDLMLLRCINGRLISKC